RARSSTALAIPQAVGAHNFMLKIHECAPPALAAATRLRFCMSYRRINAAVGVTGMKREAGAQCLSAVFVDYDNIYLSLKRKSEDAAKRFAKDAPIWLREIENGRLITPTN